uniref:Ribonuclease A-domain domain-containing protein n=1 Tax=Kryptolebias marmoratus TaxID=37003 RepID=A0A3Q3EJ02_KRYMA
RQSPIRHLPAGTPNSLNHDEWHKYIVGQRSCDRPTQSFLHPDDLERVKAVCSNRGGKVLKDNLCISRQQFTFVTVRSDKGTCGVRTVTKETKHLILACEQLENQCVPVHFKGNPTDLSFVSKEDSRLS